MAKPQHNPAPHRDVALSSPSRPGNEDGRFQLEGNTLFYLPDDLAEPCTFVLLVEVWGGPSAPRRSTVVALVVHVTPRSTPVPPSTTTRRTVSRARWPGSSLRSIRPPGPRMPAHPTASADAAEGAASHHADGGGVAPAGLVRGRADRLRCPAAGRPGLCGPEPAVQVSPGPAGWHGTASKTRGSRLPSAPPAATETLASCSWARGGCCKARAVVSAARGSHAC